MFDTFSGSRQSDTFSVDTHDTFSGPRPTLDTFVTHLDETSHMSAEFVFRYGPKCMGGLIRTHLAELLHLALICFTHLAALSHLAKLTHLAVLKTSHVR